MKTAEFNRAQDYAKSACESSDAYAIVLALLAVAAELSQISAKLDTLDVRIK